MEKEPDKTSEENFVARWSRRKVETAERGATDATETVGAQQSGDPLNALESADTGTAVDRGTQTPKDILTDEHMPPIDSLTEDSDFSGFLSPGVSEGLRQQALRKLFSSTGFNIRDGLDDYDDDFRNFAALGDLITSDMRHQMELEKERKRKAREQAAAEAEETTPEDQTDDEPSSTQETNENANHQPDDGERVDNELTDPGPTDKKSS